MQLVRESTPLPLESFNFSTLPCFPAITPYSSHHEAARSINVKINYVITESYYTTVKLIQQCLLCVKTASDRRDAQIPKIHSC